MGAIGCDEPHPIQGHRLSRVSRWRLRLSLSFLVSARARSRSPYRLARAPRERLAQQRRQRDRERWRRTCTQTRVSANGGGERERARAPRVGSAERRVGRRCTRARRPARANSDGRDWMRRATSYPGPSFVTCQSLATSALSVFSRQRPSALAISLPSRASTARTSRAATQAKRPRTLAENVHADTSERERWRRTRARPCAARRAGSARVRTPVPARAAPGAADLRWARLDCRTPVLTR